MGYGERKTLIGVVLIFIMFLMSLFYVVEEVQAYSKPSTSNGDAYLRSSGSINNDIYRVSYLYDSLFTGDVYKNPYIHKAERDGGYTCWAYNAKDYDFYAETTLRHPFGGSAGKGNESYGETLNLRQCEDGEKLIEYEIHASDNISNSSYNPSMSYSTVSGKKANYLRFTGWATLGGFTHHSGWNQSTYVVAIEQKNGKNTTSTSGVHITKAVANETNLTNFLQYGGIPTCLGNSANGSYSYEQGSEFNRYRGLNFYREHNSKYVVPGTTSVLSFYYNNVTGASPNQGDGELLRHYRANERWYELYWNPYERASIKYPVYGLGCNFYYPYAGFAAYLNLDDMIGDGKSNKDFKIYLVKRVRDMVVATEMQMPKYTEKKSIKYGTVSFEGYGNTDTVRPNRTALPPFRGYYSGSWLFHTRDWNYDGKDGYLDKGKDYKLKKVFIKEGHPSIYRIEDPDNGLPYYHYAHYFDYNQQNEGSTLKYRLDPKDVQVRHWDLLTCPNDVRGNISNLLETNIIPKGCNQVREKSTGGYAQKGDGLYSKNFYSQWFYTYQGAEVYRTSKTNDNFEDITPHRLVYLAGKGTAYVNFFYINRNEVGSLKVNYIDNQTGNKLQDSVVLNRLKKGETVSFPVPDRIIPNSGRYYYIMNSSQSSSIKITGDNVVNIKYNPNPNVTFEYIDRQTGTKLGEDTYLHQRGTNFSKTPPSSTSYSGKTYYREDSGAISYSSLWDDKVVKVYYTNDKQVEARHYDYYTCPSSVQAQRTGDLGNTSCVELREKSTGKIADKGSGTYETDKEYRFYPYSNADNNLYEDDKSGDKYTAVYPHSVVVNLQGKNKTHVNFFYINDKDLGNLRVKYEDYHTGKTLRTDYVQTRIKKGTTVSYDLPESIAGDDGRTYYLRSSYNGSVKITQDNHNITVKYNYNPNIYVKKIDRDTGKVLGTDKHHVNRGGTYNITPDSVVSSGGSNYYREDSGALTFSSVWKDTTKSVYYSKYKDVYVRHYDYYSCDLSEADNMLGPTGDVCTHLREKNTGNLATKGSGRYETDMEHRFYKYGNADDNLYSSSRSNDSYYAENSSSQVIKLAGKNVTYINFFYKNRQDEAKLTVKYVDRQSGKTLRSTYTKSNVEKGTTVDYPVPSTLSDGSRTFYKYSSYNGSIRLLEDTTLTVLYNYNPKVTIKKIDRDTGDVLGTDVHDVTRGGTHNITPDSVVSSSGSNYYREDSGAITFSSIWKDTTKNVYYSKYKDVYVRHYDYYSCDLNEANNMIGPTGDVCTQLREKSTGNLATKGSGRYETDKAHRFYKYADADDNLYSSSRTQDSYYAENASSQVINLNGKSVTYINFFYKNRQDEAKLTVKYVDRQSGKTLRSTYTKSNVEKGTVVDYPIPDTLLSSARQYYKYSDYNGSIRLLEDTTLTVLYNYDPKIKTELVDRETGNIISTYGPFRRDRGVDYDTRTNASTSRYFNGSNHYRIDDSVEVVSGESNSKLNGHILEDVWKDTTIRYYYSGVRDVQVIHYDEFSCDSSGNNCDQLKEKSSGKNARKGSGKYYRGYHDFVSYNTTENKLYNKSSSDNFFKVKDGGGYSNEETKNEYITVSHSTVNNNTPYYVKFYYINKAESTKLTVEYRDNLTGKKLRNDHVENYIQKGKTVDYPTPVYINNSEITGSSRNYFPLEDYEGSVTMTDDKKIVLYYNYQPQLTVESVDRETGSNIRTTRYTLSAGGDFPVGGGAVALYNWGGTYHYRIDDTKEIISGGKDARWTGDSLDIENVWEDTTVRVLYTNMRDVIVNHYDTYNKVMEGKDTPLKMKSDGSIANKGSGLYEGASLAHTGYSNARHTFSPYIDSGNKLYLRDRVNDRYRADSGSIEEFLTVNRTTVNNNTPFYVDFYYTNDEDISDVTVEYVDTKGNEIAPKKVFEDRFRNTTISRSEYFKGDVITYDGRPYELLEDNVGSSINVTGDDTTYTYVYVQRPQVTRQYIDRDTNKVIAQGQAYLKYNSSWNHKNPENITIGGTPYTSYEKPVYYTKKNIREDFTYQVEYTTEKLEKEPVEFAVKGGTTEGMTDIDDVSWTMDEEGITTKSELEISGVHADIEGAEVREFYTTTDNFDDAYTTTKDGKKTRFKHSEVLDKNSPKYSHTEDMHKKPWGSHHLEVEYKYTNVLKKDFKCDYGETEDWCFEWSEKSTDTRTPYWGERDPNEKVKAELPNGKVEDVPVYNEYLLEMELDNNSDVGKDVTVTNSNPLDEKLEIGRAFVGSDGTVGEEKVTEGSFKGDVSEIKSYYEELEMTPKLDFENDTQSGIKFNDSIGYANDYGTKFEETEYVGDYLVKLDKNLANKLPEEDGLSKVGVIYDKDTEEFRFDKVFGITQKYGIQVMADYEEYKENPNVLETKMHEELELLELGNDELVELDYTDSRYFLPIDDATDVKSNNIEDGVELDELGVTDINVKYVKGIEYDDYLYGNVFDDPIYAAQKEETKKVEYKNSETLDNDKLKEIEKYLDENEREDRVNLYRITDDEDIKDLLSE